jgi:hypothetical protein
MEMSPVQLSTELRRIAAKIDNSNNPSCSAVAADLKELILKISAEKSPDISWLEEKHQKELKDLKKAPEMKHNPPEWVKSEPTWDKAKAEVKKDWNKYDEPWAVVADVYGKMGGEKK